jgi:hypothetical protein
LKEMNMYPELIAFRNDIARDVGNNAYWLKEIENGRRLFRDGTDITDEFAADARRRLSEAEAMLAQLD